jgi:hypothetical protein
MWFIVPDEQRSNGPKSARPKGVALCSPLSSVAGLARATGPRCAPLLVSGLHSTIKVDQSHIDRPQLTHKGGGERSHRQRPAVDEDEEQKLEGHRYDRR